MNYILPPLYLLSSITTFSSTNEPTKSGDKTTLSILTNEIVTGQLVESVFIKYSFAFKALLCILDPYFTAVNSNTAESLTDKVCLEQSLVLRE